jgi:hypothetical protein
MRRKENAIAGVSEVLVTIFPCNAAILVTCNSNKRDASANPYGYYIVNLSDDD